MIEIKPRHVLILSLMLMYIILGLWMATSYHDCCSEEAKLKQTRIILPKLKAAIYIPANIASKWGECTLYDGDSIQIFIDSLCDVISKGQSLTIMGLYSPIEHSDTANKNLGLCRAQLCKEKLLKTCPNIDISIQSKAVVGVFNDSSYFDCFEYHFNRQDTTKTASENYNNNTTLYFPSGSIDQIHNPEIEQYLTKLAHKLNKDNLKIQVIGHTDNQGADMTNLSLSNNRAKAIKDILIDLGAETSNITTIGKGESEPIAPNTTEQGRAKNRRTEIKIITSSLNNTN